MTKSNGPPLLAGTRVTGTQPHLGTFYGWLRPVAAAAQEMPPYSPDTNQDEWVWNNVKTTQVGRKMITSVSDLYSNVLGALRRLQENPGIVRGFFGDPNLAYIAWQAVQLLAFFLIGVSVARDAERHSLDLIQRATGVIAD